MKAEWQSNLSRRWLALACGFCLAAGALGAQDKDEITPSSVPPAAPLATEKNADPATPAEGVTATEAPVSEVISNVTETVAGAGPRSHREHRSGDNPKVVIGNDAEVRPGETVDAFVVIGGNGVVKGKVMDAAVVVFGDLDISGEVKNEAVAVLGSIHVRSNAVVHGDAVSVGGEVEEEEGATVLGHKQGINLGPFKVPQFKKVAAWVNECVFKLRPLSPTVGWVWVVAGVIFLFYLLVAVVLQKPVQTCVNEITRRPVTTFFTGLLTKLVAPIVMLILVATGIGLIVVPFLWAALFFAAIIGKVALIEYIGDSLRRAVGGGEPLKPVIALCVGTLLILICYNIPILGLLTFALLAVWGLGVGVTTAFGSFKREAPPKAAPPMAPAGSVGQPGFIAPMPVVAAAAPFADGPAPISPLATSGSESGGGAPAAGQVPPFAPMGAPSAGAAPSPASGGMVPAALAFPRAGFWERMGAAFLDLVIVGILSGITGGIFARVVPAFPLLVALAYFAGMWTWKGTTIGGVVLSLRVVRLDNGPVTFSVALVRGLGAALSAVVLFLGFLWIAWDDEKQGWHDRIAGTVVVRMPRGTPLVML